MSVQDPKSLLTRLCQERGESDWLEFKVSNESPEMIGQWISACANAAILSGRENAFLVFGVEDTTRRLVGTSISLNKMKKGGEVFSNWIGRMVEPRMVMEFKDFDYKGKNFSIIAVEPTYDRPVRFAGVQYIRIGENIKKLAEFPEHERAIWYATGRRKFESAVALPHQSQEHVLELLDIAALYRLLGVPKPKEQEEQIRRLCLDGYIQDDLEGGFNISNLGAVLFAAKIGNFPSIATKSVRVIKYTGTDKTKSDDELEGSVGYAVGFAGLIRHVMRLLPKEEQYIDGVRKMVPAYPETAIREFVANALIHQDFTISGSGPVIDIYTNRIEISNPGHSLIEVNRIIDERRSRNEKLASTMRGLGLCEERGGGIDKAITEIERSNLTAPLFLSSEHSMRVVLFDRKPFAKLNKQEKLRACFQHCVLRWMTQDYMSNTSLRERFSLQASEYQAASSIIAESIKAKAIKPAELDQGKRNARYIPFFG